jgi:hypothetical protein
MATRVALAITWVGAQIAGGAELRRGIPVACRRCGRGICAGVRRAAVRAGRAVFVATASGGTARVRAGGLPLLRRVGSRLGVPGCGARQNGQWSPASPTPSTSTSTPRSMTPRPADPAYTARPRPPAARPGPAGMHPGCTLRPVRVLQHDSWPAYRKTVLEARRHRGCQRLLAAILICPLAATRKTSWPSQIVTGFADRHASGCSDRRLGADRSIPSDGCCPTQIFPFGHAAHGSRGPEPPPPDQAAWAVAPCRHCGRRPLIPAPAGRGIMGPGTGGRHGL